MQIRHLAHHPIKLAHDHVDGEAPSHHPTDRKNRDHAETINSHHRSDLPAPGSPEIHFPATEKCFTYTVNHPLVNPIFARTGHLPLEVFAQLSPFTTPPKTLEFPCARLLYVEPPVPSRKRCQTFPIRT